MSEAFSALARQHLTRYPAMQPQDLAKLAYQAAWGPAHLADARDAVLAALRREWAALPPKTDVPAPEAVGGGLSRLHLDPRWDECALPLVTDLLLRTAAAHGGTEQDFARRLDAVASLPVEGMAAWLADYRAAGCPAVHHSEAYRAAYQPHYRLLRADYAGYFPALYAASQAMQAGKPVLLAVDGRCGSGKTGLALLMQQVLGAQVVHMDDFFLPPDRRAADWETQPAGNMDLARLAREVLDPLRAGQAAVYRPFSCQSGQLGDQTTLRPAPLTVIEGSYSLHPSLAARYDLGLFLTCPPETQADRLRAREGAHFAAFEARWIPFEERYFARCGVQEAASLVIDTHGLF